MEDFYISAAEAHEQTVCAITEYEKNELLKIFTGIKNAINNAQFNASFPYKLSEHNKKFLQEQGYYIVEMPGDCCITSNTISNIFTKISW